MKEVQSAVSNLLSELRAPAVSEQQMLQQMAPVYAYTCGEALDAYQASPGSFNLSFSAQAQSGFASTINNFSQSEHIARLRNWSINDTGAVISSYQRFLSEGNCPPDSPGVLRPKLTREYSILSELFLSQGNGRVREGSDAALSAQAAEQSRRIAASLKLDFFMDDDLRALDVIADMAQNPRLRRIARGLIITSNPDEYGSIPFPGQFSTMWRVAENYDSDTWRQALRHVLSALIIKKIINLGEWDWEERLENLTFEAGVDRGAYHRAQAERFLKSVFLLLHDGEIELAREFLRILAGWESVPPLFDALIHVTAAQPLNDVRRLLVRAALYIAESGDPNGYSERPLAAALIGLLAYPEGEAQLEQDLLTVLRKQISASFDGASQRDSTDDYFEIKLIGAIQRLYEDLKKKRLPPADREKYLSQSVVAQALRIAATQKFNHIRRALLNSAFTELEHEHWDSVDRALDYLEPMQDPGEEERIDNNDRDPWAYYYDYQKRKGAQSGNGNSGSSSPTSSSTPSVPSSSTPPRLSSAPRIDGFYDGSVDPDEMDEEISGFFNASEWLSGANAMAMNLNNTGQGQHAAYGMSVDNLAFWTNSFGTAYLLALPLWTEGRGMNAFTANH